MIPTLHIVHPYTYKVEGKTLIGEPIQKFRERDEKISRLVNTALTGGKVVRYYSNPIASFGILEEIGALLKICDPLFAWSEDRRIIDITSNNGVPIANKRPEKISEEDWRICTRQWTQASKLRSIVSDSSPNVFIGGYLENCLANAIGYHQNNYCKIGEETYYVPELCSRNPGTPWDQVKPKLDALNAKEITFERALELFVP